MFQGTKSIIKASHRVRLAVIGVLISAALPAISAPPSPELEAAPDPTLRAALRGTDQLLVRLNASSTRFATAGGDGARLLGTQMAVELAAKLGSPVSYRRHLGDHSLVLKLDRFVNDAEMPRLLARLAAHPDVAGIEPDRIAFPAALPADPLFSAQWALQTPGIGNQGALNLNGAWNLSTGSTSQVVAVVDTGILNHPDLSGRLLPGYDFVSNTDKPRGNDGNGRDSDASDPGDWVSAAEASAGQPFEGCSVLDSSWHGTEMAGVIAANANNATGIAGINWNTKILPVRAIGKCGGYVSDIADGIRWAAGLSVAGVPANPNPAQVINLSLAVPTLGACDTAFKDAIQAVGALNIPVIAAAGNNNAQASQYSPGNCASDPALTNLITVTAVARNGGLPRNGQGNGYANTGAPVHIAAPGGSLGAGIPLDTSNAILSTSDSGLTAPNNDGGVSLSIGTSYAAAHISGIVSLMRAVNPAVSPADLRQILTLTARTFPTPADACNTTLCGAGIADAARAVLVANRWGRASLQVAAGVEHSLALRNDGTVLVWGGNSAGQLGLGANVSSSGVPQPLNLLPVIEIAAGAYRSIALRADGLVMEWGAAASNTPQIVAGLSGISTLAAGEAHTLALRDDGSVWAWGNNSQGQLGVGDNVDRATPVQVPGLSGVVSIGAGAVHSFAILANGSAWVWGGNSLGQLGDGTQTSRTSPVQVAALANSARITGSNHSVAVMASGAVLTFGQNNLGQLGNGGTTANATPTAVSGLSTASFPANGPTQAISMVRMADGSLRAWGDNGYGQLGDGTQTQRRTPVLVRKISNVVSVAAGQTHSLAVRDDGTVWIWGRNVNGQLGISGNTSPVYPTQVLQLGFGAGSLTLNADSFANVHEALPGLTYTSNDIVPAAVTSAQSISVTGGEYSLDGGAFVATSGTILPGQTVRVRTQAPVNCGANAVVTLTIGGVNRGYQVNRGACDDLPDPVSFTTQFNIPPNTTVTSNTVTISGLAGPVAVSILGGSYSIGCNGTFTTAAGTISNGQTLCLRTTSESFIDGTSTATVTMGAAEFSFLVVTGITEVLPLGTSFGTQLSVPRNVFLVSNPITITGFTGPAAISVIGGEYSLGCNGVFTAAAGTVTPGTIVCVRLLSPAGYSEEGSLLLQIGSGYRLFVVYTEPSPSFTPTPQVAGGAAHSLALRADGTLLSWGQNEFGELGNDVVGGTDRPTPVYLAGVKQIAAGDARSLALRLDGTVWVWGRDTREALGSELSSSAYPTQVSALGNDVVAISAGRFHNVALKSNGTVWTWGNVPALEPLAPTQVASLSGITAVHAMGRSTFALKNDGTVWAWGDNFRGQLGVGSSGNVINTPTQVTGLSGALEIAGGDYHALARFAAGVFKSWGQNEFGELGNGGSADLNAPATLSGMTTVAGLAKGTPEEWSLVRLADGTLRSWGTNSNGQLGDGTTTLRRAPVAVIGLSGVTGIAAGALHALAIGGNGAVWAWGSNSLGQLGQATGGQASLPIAVRAPAGQQGNLTLDDQGFAPLSGVVPGSEQFSNSVLLRNIAAGASISVSGGQYRIGTGAFTSSAGSVSPGQTVSLRLPTAGACGMSVTVTLSVGGSPRPFVVSSEPCDQTPDDVVFASQFDVPVSSVRVSNPVTVTGLSVVSPISVVGGEYSLGCNGSFTAAAGSIGNGQTVCVRQTASANPAVTTTVTLTIGTRSFAFAVSTAPAVAFETQPQLTGGLSHYVVLRSDGRVFSWGGGDSGQLGNGSFASSALPVQADIATVSAVAAGYDFTIALRSDGSVWQWGKGSAVPTAVPGLGNIVAIGAGNAHGLAVKSDGTVWAWGSNNRGQLGNGTQTDSAVPVQVTGASNVIQVAGGGNFSLALQADGNVLAWGRNFYGQLGDGTNIDRAQPIQVAGLTGVVQIGAGTLHSMARTLDGGLWVWGSNDFAELGNGGYEGNPDYHFPSRLSGIGLLGFIAQGSSEMRSLVSLADGTVFNWGLNSGRFAGYSDSFSAFPVRVPGLSNILRVGYGGGASLALRDDGRVLVWSNSVSELAGPAGSPPGALFRAFHYTPDAVSFVPAFGVGLSTKVESNTVTIAGLAAGVSAPVSIMGGELSVNGGPYVTANTSVQNGATLRVRLLSSANFDTTSQATVTLGGLGAQRVTFYARTRPNLSAVARVPRISLGQSHSFLLNANGEVFTFGYNGNGQLGNGTTISSSSPRPAPALANLVKISSGYFHGLGLKADGTVMGWGFNESGAVGNGTTSSAVEQPVQLAGLANVTALSAGRYHSLALSAGLVYAWGLNAEGQLGISSTVNQSAPQAVPGLSGIVAIAAGGAHSLALAANGTLYAWGRNASGQLGDGSTTTRTAPVTVSFSGAVSIAACGEHSLILKNDGTLWAMGANGFGQLGDGSSINRTVPVQVTSLTQVGLMACGEQHSMAVTAGGTLFTWGGNTASQLGEGTNNNRSTAQAVAIPGSGTLDNVVAIAGGGLHSAALRANGTLYIWGDNYFGQVGNRSGNYNPNSSGLNVLRGDTRIVEVVGGGGSSVGTSNTAGTGQLYLNDQSTGYDFGDLLVGTSASLSGQLDNTAISDPLENISLSTNGSAFSVATNSCPGSTPGLPAGSSCTFSLNFSPVVTGDYFGGVKATATNMEGSLQLALYGRGVAPSSPVLKVTTAVSPAGNNIVDFPPVVVGSTSAAQSIVINNTGSAVMAVNLVELTQGAADFTLLQSCGAINPGSSCTVQVHFAPSQSGERQGLVTINTNAGTDTVTLKGTASPRPEDTVPDAFSFTNLAGAITNGFAVSSAITITGLTAPANISVTNGEYSIGCTGTWTSVAGTISNGQTVCLRHATASTPSTTITTTLIVGGVSGLFQSTTAAAVNYSLTVSRTGAGSGAVTSSPAGINCGATCTTSLASGTVVTLTATATSGSVFAGWSGVSCTGGNSGLTCGFTLSSATTVTATFAPDVSALIARNDLNDDGKGDIVWRNGTTGENFFYPMDGRTILSSEGPIRSVPAPWVVAGVGDFDGDGKADLLWRNTSTGENYVYFMDGKLIKATEGFIRSVPTNWVVGGVADFDGDGKADILWRNSTTGENYLYFMDGRTIKATEGFIRTVATAWVPATVADFDGDGKADILWRNTTTGENYLYPMDGKAIKSTEGTVRSVATNWIVAGSGDFTGDGKADILWRNTSTGENYLYPMDGRAILGTEGFIRSVPTNWIAASVTDYDGDGKVDILWRNTSTGENYIYPMDGRTIKATEGFIRSVSIAWSVVTK